MIHADIKQHRHFSIQRFSGLQLKTRQLKHIEIFRLLQQQIQSRFRAGAVKIATKSVLLSGGVQDCSEHFYYGTFAIGAGYCHNW